VGVKRVTAGKEILQQDGRDDRRLYVVRQGTVRIDARDGDTFRWPRWGRATSSASAHA
jgi:ATP-binding cassette subfamily B protein